MKKLLLFTLLLLASSGAMAQRHTDQLDRGLVAVPTGAVGNSTTNLVSWRRLADEYYNTTYNLYRNGTRVATNLDVTTYSDNANASASYQVAAVVNGVEQSKSTAVTAWSGNAYKPDNNRRYAYGYLDIDLASVYDREGNDVTSHYEPNDAEMADLDGDGQLEIIIKRLNTFDASAQTVTRNGKEVTECYPDESNEFVVLDAYDINWQTGAATLMWRIDCGPNMVSQNSTEINIIAYDWDEDGKAEVVLRGADNMIVYGADGKTPLYTIGNMSVNTRNTFSNIDWQYCWTHTGDEYLIYMNGKTGALYQQMDYPLKRLESGESSLKKAWGDDYGHRSSKYFFGAPFLDGRKASLFLGRGIYTRHKMIAMNLDRSTHTWSEYKRWNNNSSSSPWYGNGYHNFIVADVDEDGCDEIVYGSMVIDNNMNGLSTTGYGHGDAQICGDFDPYRKGLEFFGCLEEQKGGFGCNYRNATTSEVYFKHNASKDDGRSLMANFSNDYPGSVGRSSSASGMINSLRNNTTIDAYAGDSYIPWGDLNFRIYWDGDLCSEILNSPGTAKEAKIDKPGASRLFTSVGCNMNNDSKNNPCFQGDIIGDWREEIVVRRGTGLRVYTTGMNTTWSMPSLWFDHQYRQAMVWQMMAYNQPPNPSFFLGEMENITIAPPPLTMEGRTEITSGSITSATNGKHVLLCDAASIGIDAGGISPSVLTAVVNSTVSGSDNNNGISWSTKSLQLGDSNGKGDITGTTRLVKQGDGLLKLTAREFSYTGPTDIWGGSLRFRGTLTGSDVWMNRNTAFMSGATLKKSLTMEYGATLCPSEGDAATDTAAVSYGTTTIEGTLEMHEGARIILQLDPANSKSDQVNIGKLAIRTRSGAAWENYGPKYLKPVIAIKAQSALTNGATYTLGTLEALATGTSLEDIILEGAGESAQLIYEDGKLMMKVGNENVSAPTVTGQGKIRYVTAGTSSLDNPVQVYYTTAASTNPAEEGTLLEKAYVKMPNQTTYYFYTVSSSGAWSKATTASFDGLIVEEYPFQQWAGDGYETLNVSNEVAFTEGGEHYYATSVSNSAGDSHSLNKRFGLRNDKDSKGNNVQFWMRKYTNAENTGLFCNGNGDRRIAIMNLKPGDKFTITMANTTPIYFRNSNVYLETDQAKTKVAYGTSNEDGTALVSGATYVVADDAEAGCYVLFGTNKGSYVCIKDVRIEIISVDETVSSPTIAVTANGTARTVTITPGVGSQGTAATETYYTLDGSDPTTSDTRLLYTDPFDISSTTTIKTVSYLADTSGTVLEQEVTADTTIQLNAPTLSRVDYAGGQFLVRIGSDQSTLDAIPGQLTYYYTIDGGDRLAVSGNEAWIDGGSDISVYAEAPGFEKSEETTMSLGIMPLLIPAWDIDFTTIESTAYPATAELGGYYILKSGNNALNENFGVAASSGNNQFYIHYGGLYVFYGSSKSFAIQAQKGQYIRIRASIAFNSTSAGLTKREDLCYSDYYIYEVTTTGIHTINTPRYNVIYSIEVFDVNSTIEKTITDAGWATLCSEYALDFSQPIENLVKAYLITDLESNGTTLVLSEVHSTVPARTGLLLQGNGLCEIPTISISSTDVSANKLIGVLEETVVEPAMAYVLLKENGVVGFYKNNYAFTVGAHTAYLPADFFVYDELANLDEEMQNASRYLKFTADNEVTGVREVLRPVSDNRYYNLQGQRVNGQLRRGIYIVNGKKIIKK